MHEIKGLEGQLKLNFKLWKRYLYIHWQWAFDLWPFNLVKSNIPVLHSLSSEGWQNFIWNSIILFKIYFFQNIKNSSHYLIDFMDLSGSGLNDLNSPFGLKK